ncbi:hypothetical protein [Sphingomonas montana]|uniref:hypothetical protein n=1 Tax=Sphingomonas montana TaxID=1843236 RepID=UPI00101AD8B3|nr:hypothetical protein [Sphingomonas montana]
MTNANDGENSSTTPFPVQACDRAALILAESLLRGLLERSVLTLGEAIEIVDTAIEIHAEVVEEADRRDETVQDSHTMLTAIGASLRVDLAKVDRDSTSGPPDR